MEATLENIDKTIEMYERKGNEEASKELQFEKRLPSLEIRFLN